MTTEIQIIAAVHLAATWWMAGIIGFVQAVYYPSLAKIDREQFVQVERRNTVWTGLVVGPPMLAELGSWGLLYFLAEWARSSLVFGLSGLLLLVIWTSTILLQIPCHRHLERAFDVKTVDRLVKTNWIRTFAWLSRAVLVTVAFGKAFPVNA